MAILTALSPAILAVAAETAPHAEAAAHGAEPKAGLPQLAVETFAGQLFWLAIAFVLLYVLLAFVVIPRIRNGEEPEAFFDEEYRLLPADQWPEDRLRLREPAPACPVSAPAPTFPARRR